MKRKYTLGNVVNEAFMEVYRHTSPAANYMILKRQKGDWFMNYTIGESLFEAILGWYVSFYGMTKYDEQSFRTSMYLGPSPKFTP